MGFQEAFQVGKKYLRLSTGPKVPIRKQNPPSKKLKPGGFMGNPIDQRLLNSFLERKNAELKECSRDSEPAKPDNGAEDQIAVVFFLTKKLLSKTEAPLDARFIRDGVRLEKALGKVYPRLPISIRLALGKKRYVQFMLHNRERLIP